MGLQTIIQLVIYSQIREGLTPSSLGGDGVTKSSKPHEPWKQKISKNYSSLCNPKTGQKQSVTIPGKY